MIGLKLLLRALLAALAMAASCAHASDTLLNRHACFSVSPAEAAYQPSHWDCEGEPTGFQHQTLWLKMEIPHPAADRYAPVVMLHNTRFDRLSVGFIYTDGVERWQTVSAGAFGDHWRAGGQIAFEAPRREVPVAHLVMRFDHLTSFHLLRIRLTSLQDAGRQSIMMTTAISGALTLLFLGALYNMALAFSAKRAFPAWQSAWAACMVAWGAIWSQLHLLIAPQFAGTASSQTCTVLSCLAIALATQAAVAALPSHYIHPSLRKTTQWLGWAIAILGAPLGAMRTGPIDLWAEILGVVTMADLWAVAWCLTSAWRQGSREAGSFAGAWAVPMLVLAATTCVDLDSLLWGGGSQMAVLIAATWQTIWLSIATTRQFTLLRVERDLARQSEAYAFELARRDPLTGLRNRRGFFDVIAEHEQHDCMRALLLIDIDHFKLINDTHGHDIGDQVLRKVGERLARWDGPACNVARFGGEEFVMMLTGIRGKALFKFADQLRETLSMLVHEDGVGQVTVSIGVAETARSDFQVIYKAADEALYKAKREGRNRVIAAPVVIDANTATPLVARHA